MTTPGELRHWNIDHFEHLLERTKDAEERAKIQRLIEEERAKVDGAYPASRSGWKPYA
jgi:hypothetical protein